MGNQVSQGPTIRISQHEGSPVKRQGTPEINGLQEIFKFRPRVRLLPEGLAIVEAGEAALDHEPPNLLPFALERKDLKEIPEAGSVQLEEAVYASRPTERPRAALRVTWDLDFDVSMLREEARSVHGGGTPDMLLSSPPICIPAVPCEEGIQEQEGTQTGRSGMSMEPQLAACVADLEITEAVNDDHANQPWCLLPLLKGTPRQTAAFTYWCLVFSRTTPGNVSLSLQRLPISTAHELEPHPFSFPPSNPPTDISKALYGLNESSRLDASAQGTSGQSFGMIEAQFTATLPHQPTGPSDSQSTSAPGASEQSLGTIGPQTGTGVPQTLPTAMGAAKSTTTTCAAPAGLPPHTPSRATASCAATTEVYSAPPTPLQLPTIKPAAGPISLVPPALADPKISFSGKDPPSVSLQWSFLVQGLTTDSPHPVTHFQGSAPVHSYTATSSPQCGLKLVLDHQLDLSSLSHDHTLRVVAVLQPPVQEAQTGEQQQQQVRLFAEPCLARHASSPLSPSLLDQPVSSGTFAAPAPAAEEHHITLISVSPRIILLEDLLDLDTCEALKELAQPQLSKSKVSAGTETPSRTSQGTFFTGDSTKLPLIENVERRIEWLMNHPALITGKLKLGRTEALQVVAYNPGEFYTEHYDNKAGSVVTRSATIIVYLGDCPSGGATYFPKSTGIPTTASLPGGITAAQLAELTGHLHNSPAVPRPGLRVAPARGRAIVFWSSLPNGAEDLASLHAAEPVLAGDKWIVTRWFKQQTPSVQA